jgi:putative aldouronate transport system permease protein
MTLPAIVFFALLSYIPMVGIYYAFTTYNFKAGLFGSPFVGLKNFDYLFSGGLDSIILRITTNTVLYNLIFILLGNTLQVITAVVLSELSHKLFKRVSQSFMFLPHFVSYVLVAVLAYNLFSYEYGIINNTLKLFGVEAVNLYATPNAWWVIIPLVYFWKTLGYGMVIYLAAIMGIDREMYEAADIDGANVFQRIWSITMPNLKPTFIILLLFSLGSILRGQFDLFYQLVGRNGMLFSTTDIIDTYVYRSLMQNFNIGLGTAAGLYQSLFGMITVLTVNFIVKKLNPDYSLF